MPVITHVRIHGGRGSKPALETTSFYAVSLKTLVQTPLKMQLDPFGPIASQQGSLLPSVKYVNDFLGSRLCCLTVNLSLSHWYPGPGVVLYCIDS